MVLLHFRKHPYFSKKWGPELFIEGSELLMNLGDLFCTVSCLLPANVIFMPLFKAYLWDTIVTIKDHFGPEVKLIVVLS